MATKNSSAKEAEQELLNDLDQQLLRGGILGYGRIKGALKTISQDGDLEDPKRSEDDLDADRGLDSAINSMSLLAGEARPGTGIVAVQGVEEIGPSGALGLFLVVDKEPDDIWFLAAGHVLTGLLGRVTPESSSAGPSVPPAGANGPVLMEPTEVTHAFRSRNGLLAGVIHRKLGRVRYVTQLEPAATIETRKETVQIVPSRSPLPFHQVDAGLVRLDGPVAWVQESTCYGGIAALTKAQEGDVVKKCGPEEPFNTGGVVRGLDWKFRAVHDKKVYLFEKQILVRCGTKDDLPEQVQPFALPGDSGSLVVNEKRQPIGLLIAGSVRHNYFFLNQISELEMLWRQKNLRQVDIAKITAASPDIGAPQLPRSTSTKEKSLRGARSGSERGF